MHPFINDLDHLKDSEVEAKINDLSKKYWMTYNPEVRQQIIMVLDTYREELAKRRKAEYDKMMQSQGKGLDKLINIS